MLKIVIYTEDMRVIYKYIVLNSIRFEYVFIKIRRIFTGGVPKELHKRQSKHIHSRHGFEGCMSGLEYNGESPDMVENATIPSTLITVGCDGKFMNSLHQSSPFRYGGDPLFDPFFTDKP